MEWKPTETAKRQANTPEKSRTSWSERHIMKSERNESTFESFCVVYLSRTCEEGRNLFFSEFLLFCAVMLCALRGTLASLPISCRTKNVFCWSWRERESTARVSESWLGSKDWKNHSHDKLISHKCVLCYAADGMCKQWRFSVAELAVAKCHIKK